MGRRTSVWLPSDLDEQLKASGAKLADLIRRGLDASKGGTPAPSGASGDGTAPGDAAEVAVSGDWVAVQEAAAVLSISASRVHHLLSVGYLASRKADDGWRRMVSAESVRAELDRRKHAYYGSQGPYADAASTYQAETQAAYFAAIARHTGPVPATQHGEVNHDDHA
jgi:hypothetical protein